MPSFNRKKYKRYANRVIREMNERLVQDPEFRGRYYAHQLCAIDAPFHDKSGRHYMVLYECIDRQTGKTELHNWYATYWHPHNESYLYNVVNLFIAEREEEEKTRGDYCFDVSHGVARYLPNSPHSGDAERHVLDTFLAFLYPKFVT